MIVLSALENGKTGQGLAADSGIRNHSLNGELNRQLRTGCHQGAVLGGLEAADVSGVTIVELLVELGAGQDDLSSVENDDVVTAIYMRSKDRLMLSAKKVGNLGSDTAERLACGVNDIPVAADFAGFWHIS